MVVVRLARLNGGSAENNERTYTDNLSAHGARVFSKQAWQPGERAQITPALQESPVSAEVIYCEKLDNERYCIGLKSLDGRLPWPILQRFNGL